MCMRRPCHDEARRHCATRIADNFSGGAVSKTVGDAFEARALEFLAAPADASRRAQCRVPRRRNRSRDARSRRRARVRRSARAAEPPVSPMPPRASAWQQAPAVDTRGAALPEYLAGRVAGVPLRCRRIRCGARRVAGRCISRRRRVTSRGAVHAVNCAEPEPSCRTVDRACRRARTSHATNRRARRGQTQDSMSVERIQQHFRDSAAVKLESLETLAVPIAAAIDALFAALANGQ